MNTHCNSHADRVAIQAELAAMPKLNEGHAEICPNCEKSWRGSPIPKQHRHLYAPGSTHYSNLIGVEISGYYDGIIYWKCPHCGSTFRRF